MSPPPEPSPRVRGVGVAFFVLVAALLAAVPGLGTDEGFATGTWVGVVLPVAVLTTLLLWTLVVPRGGGRAAVWCGVAAVLSLVVFRAGATIPLAGAALVLGRGTPQDDPAHQRSGCAGMVLALVALVATAYYVAVDAANRLG